MCDVQHDLRHKRRSRLRVLLLQGRRAEAHCLWRGAEAAAVADILMRKPCGEHVRLAHHPGREYGGCLPGELVGTSQHWHARMCGLSSQMLTLHSARAAPTPSSQEGVYGVDVACS